MSVVFGIINKSKKKVSVDEIETFLNTYSHIPADYVETFIDDNFAFGFMGIDILTEGYLERQPLISEDKRFICAFRARIDNRKDIFNQLGITSKESEEISDAALILKSFFKWGNSCFDRFAGDFAGIIWDRYEKRLIAARDYNGHYPLYYSEYKDKIYFASTIRGLLGFPFIDRTPDIPAILSFALRNDINSEDSTYKYIKQFEKRKVYWIDRNGIKKEDYVDYSRFKLISYNKDIDYYEHAGHLFREIVSNCLSTKGKTGGFLSGGLDSSSVNVTASEILSNIGQRLYSYSSVPLYHDVIVEYKSTFSDESPYIDEIIKMHPNIIHQYVRCEDYGPVDALFTDLNENMTFTCNSQNAYWIYKIYELAHLDNINVLLNGQSGNSAYSLSGKGLAEEYFRNINLPAFLRLVIMNSKGNPVRIIRRIIGEIYTILNAYYPIIKKNKDNVRLNILNMTPVKSDIIKKYKLDLPESTKEEIPAEAKYLSNFEKKLFFRNTFYSKAYTQNADYHLSRKMESRDPTSDRRLIEFSWSLPASFHNDGKLNKKLARTVMKGHLPDLVRLNMKRGKQAKDISQRVINQQDKIMEMLQEYRNTEFANLFDIDRMESFLSNLETIKATQEGFSQSVKTVLNGLYIAELLKIQNK